MYFSSAVFGLAALTAVNAASNWTIQVAVGPDGILEYSPSSIYAPQGSKVEFIFNPKNHTVTQSTFDNPCQPSPNGFFSGFQPTTSASSSSFTVTVNDTTPIWFYCGQTKGDHCQAGMVGAINPPTTGNTLEKFIALAAKAKTSTNPPVGPVGGVLNNEVMVASSSFATAAATDYSVSTYTKDGKTVVTTIATTTIFETVLVAATAAPATTTSSSSSSSTTSTSTSTGGAAERTAHLLGVAAVGLGALAFL